MIKNMNLIHEKYGLSSFLFYPLKGKEEVDLAQIDKLKNSSITGLLSTTAFEKEGEIYLRYDVVSDISLVKLFTGAVSKERLYSSLFNTVETMLNATQSGLNIESFVLDKQYIFHDTFSNRLVFIYLPLKNNVFEKVSLKQFFMELLTLAPYDENDDLSFFIKLHNYLVACSEIDLQDFFKKLTELMNVSEAPAYQFPDDISNFYSPSNEVKTSIEHGVVTSEYKSKKTSQKLEIEEEVQYKRITRTELGENESLLDSAASLGGTSINIIPNVKTHSDDEGTTVLNAYNSTHVEEDGTTALGINQSSSSQSPFLLAIENHEKINITKDFFKIGRDPGQTDYTSKNKVVGRIHAHVITSDGEYFLEDNHSRNGSFVNGVKLVPANKVKIKHEDTIKLANDEFVFRLF